MAWTCLAGKREEEEVVETTKSQLRLQFLAWQGEKRDECAPNWSKSDLVPCWYEAHSVVAFDSIRRV